MNVSAGGVGCCWRVGENDSDLVRFVDVRECEREREREVRLTDRDREAGRDSETVLELELGGDLDRLRVGERDEVLA